MRPRQPFRWLLLLAVLSILGGAPPTAAQEAGPSVFRRGTINEDLYLAGGRVDVLADVTGDVIAAGGRVAIGRRVTGDAMAVGGDVTISGEVLDDVRAVGGLVTLGAGIRGDAIAVGGSVNLPPEATVGGRAWLAGGTIEVRGRVMRSLRAAGGTIRIGGRIEGDVDLAAQEIKILPGARIAGNLTYRSPREVTIGPEVTIGGTVTHHPIRVVARMARIGAAVVWAVRVVVLVGLMLAGIVLVLLLPEATLRAARTIRSDVWKSLGVGFALLVACPAAAALLVITAVGAPLGVALLALYLVALEVAVVVAALFLGDLGVRRFRREPGRLGRVLALVIGMIVLGLLRAIPFAGWPIGLLALLLGLGATGVSGYRAYAGVRPSAR